MAQAIRAAKTRWLYALVKSQNSGVKQGSDYGAHHRVGLGAIDQIVDALVGKLHKKIGADSYKPVFIKTIRGTGYKFTARVQYS